MASFDIDALEACFELPSIKATFCGLHESLGLITAVAASPDKVNPSEWIEQIKATPETKLNFEDKSQLKEFTQNLVSWWNYCTTFYDHGHQLVLPEKIGLIDATTPNQALIDFATGYLRGYSWLSKTWQMLLPDEETEATRSLLVLNLILSRFIDEEAVAESEPEFVNQLPDLEDCFKALPSLLSAVGMLGKDLAHQAIKLKEKNIKAPTANRLKDIGRNDPCPCGSGKKFKKCCLH